MIHLPRLALLTVLGAYSLNFRTIVGTDRTVLPAPPLPSRIPVTPFDEPIESCALAYRLDPLLLKAIIAVESEFDAHRVSPRGAVGLMQLLPATARRLQVRDLYEPRDNIRGGARHFRYLMDKFANDIPKSLAAYNAGEIPVMHFHGIPPYRETQKYVVNVIKIYTSYKS